MTRFRLRRLALHLVLAVAAVPATAIAGLAVAPTPATAVTIPVTLTGARVSASGATAMRFSLTAPAYAKLAGRSYVLDFGDGKRQDCIVDRISCSTLPSTVDHVYASRKAFTATLRVFEGGTNPAGSATAAVDLRNRAPVVSAVLSPPTADRFNPATMALDLTGTTDPDGAADLARWSVVVSHVRPDGLEIFDVRMNNTWALLPKPVRFNLVGDPTRDVTYTADIDVTDVVGATTSTTQTIVVKQRQVTAALTAAPNTTAGSPKFSMNLTPSVSGRDVALVSSWRLDFGDGTTVQTGTGRPPATIVHTYPSTAAFTATLTVRDASNRLLATATRIATPTNRSPLARMQIIDGAFVLYSTTDPTLNAAVEIDGPSTSLRIDTTDSTDPDGVADIASRLITVTGPLGIPAPAIRTATTATATFTFPGAATVDVAYDVALRVTDASGATNTNTARVTVRRQRNPLVNRPPVARLGLFAKNSFGGGLITLDPGLSYDPDDSVPIDGRLDSIASWKIELVDLDGVATIVKSGTGQPTRSEPVILPNDRRGGNMFARLTVTDTRGASSSAVQTIVFNTCASSQLAVENDSKRGPAEVAGQPGAFFDLTVTELRAAGNRTLPANAVMGVAPLRIDFTDLSFERGDATIVDRTFADIGMYAEGSFEGSLTIDNELGEPLVKTYRIFVRDSAGRMSAFDRMFVVLPSERVIASLDVTPDPTLPSAMVATPSVVGNVGGHAWRLQTAGTGVADISRTFEASEQLSPVSVTLPRSAGEAKRAVFGFQYGGSDIGDLGLSVGTSVCRQVDLPVLTQRQANRLPKMTITPAVQSTAGTAALTINVEDPDPAALGDAAQQETGIQPDQLVGIKDLTINGQNAQALGADFVPGPVKGEYVVEIPSPATRGPVELTVRATDFFGGETTKSATVLFEPERLSVDGATITMSHTPANLGRGGTVVENVKATMSRAVKGTVLLAVDIPAAATLQRALTGGPTALPAVGVDAIAPAITPRAGLWSCNKHVDTIRTRLVCSTLMPGATPTPNLWLTLSSTAPQPTVVLAAGLGQIYTGPTVDVQLRALRDAANVSSMRVNTVDTVPIVGFSAHAGADFSGPSVTIGRGGERIATEARLDGIRSTSDGRLQTIGWRQVSGPPVMWTSPTTGTGAALRATGLRPTFRMPLVAANAALVFELSIAVPAAGGLPAETKTDQVRVTVTPPPNRPPVVTALSSNPSAGTSTPTAGTRLTMQATASDPDGGTPALTWKAWVGTGTTGTAVATAAGTGAARTLVWPANVRQLTVEVTATDALGGVGRRAFVLGVPLAALTVAVTGLPGAITPGASVTLTAATNRTPSGSIAWTVVSGPAPAGFPATGAAVTFRLPTVTSGGQRLVLRATATDAGGNVSRDLTIDLPAAPPPTVALDVWPGNGAFPGNGGGILDALQPVLVPKSGLFSAAARATGTGTITYAWSTSPALAAAIPAAPNIVTSAPANDTLLNVTVRVTDASGGSAQATRLIQVGAGAPTFNLCGGGGGGGGDPVAAAGVATADATAVAGTPPLSIPLGSPPVGVIEVDPITFNGDCAAPSIAFSGARLRLLGLLSGDNLGGSFSGDRFCFTAGQVNLPADLGLPAVPIGTAANPLCISTDPGNWVGSDAALPASPAPNPSEPPRTSAATTPPDPSGFRLPTISCPGANAPVQGSITWPTAFPGMTLGSAVPKKTTVTFDCTSIVVTATASTPWGDLAFRGLGRRNGSLEARVVTKGMRLFGASSNTDLTGDFRRSSTGQITWAATADIASPNLGTTAVAISTIRIAVGSDGLSATANGRFTIPTGPTIDVAVDVDLTGSDAFIGSFSGTLAAPWTPVPGVTVSSGSLRAELRRATAATTFDARLTIGGEWRPVTGVLVQQLQARLSNQPAPADCGVVGRATWLQLSGNGRVEVGAPAPAVNLSVSACVGLSAPSFSISSTASLNSWKPVPNVDLTLRSVGIAARKPANGEWTIDLVGQADYAGIALAGRARFLPSTGSLVLDAAGDLRRLNLPPLATGHVVFATAGVTGYVPVAIQGQTAPLAIDLPQGLTAFADITLDTGIRTALGKIINPPAPQPPLIPIPQSIRFTASLSATSVRLEGRLAFPQGRGLTLFATCPPEAPRSGGGCMTADPLTTSLQLTELFISFDTTGTLGFGGRGRLQFASSDGVQPPSVLQVTAEASIDLTGPAINLALYFTGDWVNALGIEGLTLRDLAIQGGVSFVSYPPIPTIGVGATVVRLPDRLAAMVGIQNDRPEPMRFVLNVAPTKPIFELTIGEQDGHAVMKPLQPISAAHANALSIDYASIVFAPLGGSVGPYVYQPGISLGFAGSVVGVTASGSARITLSPPNIHADLDIGEIQIGSGASATRVRRTKLLLDLTPTSAVVEVAGGVAIRGGPDLALGLNVSAALVPPSASATFRIDVTNWQLPGGLASLKRLHASGALGLSFGSLPSASAAVDAVVRVGTRDIAVSGSLTIANGRLTALSVAGSVGVLALGPVSVGGPGCDGSGPLTGACVRAAFNAAQSSPLSIGVEASLGVAGMEAALAANFGPTGIHGSARLSVPGFNPVTGTGDLWFGSGLTGVSARDHLGVLRTVAAGDFRFQGAATAAGPLAGSSVTIDFGRIGGIGWIKGAGKVVLSGHTLGSAQLTIDSQRITLNGSVSVRNPASTTGATIDAALNGTITYPAGRNQLGFSLTGNIAAQSSSADPALRTLASGSFTLARGTAPGATTSFRFNAVLALQGMSGSVSGNVATNGTFCLAGSLSIASLSATGSVSIGSTCPTPGFAVDVSTRGFRFAGRISASGGAVRASFDDTRGAFVTPVHPFTAIDLTPVADHLSLTTKVNGTLRWTNTGGFAVTSSFAATTTLVWQIRFDGRDADTAFDDVYRENFRGSLGVTVSGSKLCVNVSGLGNHCLP